MLVAHRVNNPAFVVVVVVVPAKCGYLDVGAADAIARSIALFATFRPAIFCACCVVCVSLCTDDDDTNFFEFFFLGKEKTQTKEKEKNGSKNAQKNKKKAKKKAKKKG